MYSPSVPDTMNPSYTSERHAMKIQKLIPIIAAILTTIILAVVIITAVQPDPPTNSKLDYGFHTTLPQPEADARSQFVKTAQRWVGCAEGDGSHKPIIDLYNSHPPLARNYEVQYTDEWCATFVSAVSIRCGFTDIIPTECGCERQIELFKQLNAWEESDDYKPLPGDIIYYCWKNTSKLGDCIGWSDHVGIVVGTSGDYMKVIEGNYNEKVAYRYIKIGADGIRGFALPNFSGLNG